MPEPAKPAVNTDVPVDLDPRVVDQLAATFPPSDPTFLGIRGTLTTMHASAAKLADAEKALAATKHDQSQVARLRAAADSHYQAIEAATAKALDDLAADEAKTSVAAADALGIPAGRASITDGLRCADIRSALRRMTDTDRQSTLKLAIEHGDLDVIQACYSASPLASGFRLNDPLFGPTKTMALARFAPAETARRAALGKLREKLERAAASAKSRFAPARGKGGSLLATAEQAIRELEGGAAQ